MVLVPLVDLPWPWSQLVFELNGTAVLALAALPVLAIALEINGAFRWLSLFWTAAITFTLLAFGHYLLDVFDLIVSPELQVLLVFSTFLAAAWIGCVKPRQDAMARSALN